MPCSIAPFGVGGLLSSPSVVSAQDGELKAAEQAPRPLALGLGLHCRLTRNGVGR